MGPFTPCSPSARVLYVVIGIMADGMHDWMTWLGMLPKSRPAVDYKASSLDGMSDEEIITLFKATPRQLLSDIAGVFLGDESLGLITHDIVFKVTDFIQYDSIPPEVVALDIVFRHTTIPVPRVHHIWRLNDGHVGGFFMDHIPGRQLCHAWPTMSIFAKLRVAFILRGYLRQLRAIRHPRAAVPGPLAAVNEPPLTPDIPLFDRGPNRDPFSSYAELSAFMNERNAMARRGGAGNAEPFDDSAPLVLTHCDLNMRNILIGDDGRLWLIDWAWAGFWPPWFEYVNLKVHNFMHDLPLNNDRVWSLLIPFICGSYLKQEEWLYNMNDALCCI